MTFLLAFGVCVMVLVLGLDFCASDDAIGGCSLNSDTIGLIGLGSVSFI